MKKFLSGLMALALVTGGLAQGQTPAPMVAPGAPVVLVGPTGGACADGRLFCGRDACCKPEQYMKKTTHVCYSSGCEPLCLCYFRGLFRQCDCESGHCERAYTRRYLIKKVHTSEECATHCVPSQAATCGSGCCGGVVSAVSPPAMMGSPAQPVR